MQAEDRSAESSSSHPRSGVILRSPVRVTVDAYAGDDEITLRAIPMPVIISRSRLTLVCLAWLAAGAALGLAAGVGLSP